MSVGVFPYSGGQLHVGPVQCISCILGDVIDDGSPDDVAQSLDRINVNPIDFDNNAANGDYQFSSTLETKRAR